MEIYKKLHTNSLRNDKKLHVGSLIIEDISANWLVIPIRQLNKIYGESAFPLSLIELSLANPQLKEYDLKYLSVYRNKYMGRYDYDHIMMDMKHLIRLPTYRTVTLIELLDNYLSCFITYYGTLTIDEFITAFRNEFGLNITDFMNDDAIISLLNLLTFLGQNGITRSSVAELHSRLTEYNTHYCPYFIPKNEDYSTYMKELKSYHQ